MTARLAWAAVAAWALWKVDQSGVTGQPFSSARLLAPGLTSMIIVLVAGAVAACLIGVGWRPR